MELRELKEIIEKRSSTSNEPSKASLEEDALKYV